MTTVPSNPASGARPAGLRPYTLDVGVVGRAYVRHVIRAELLEESFGENYGHHRLPDHRRSRHRAGVGALLEGPRGLPGREVHGAQRPRYRRDRLHRRRDDDGLSVGHPALEPPEAVARAREVALGFPREDLHLHLAGAAGRQSEAQPELDTFYGVYGGDGG